MCNPRWVETRESDLYSYQPIAMPRFCFITLSNKQARNRNRTFWKPEALNSAYCFTVINVTYAYTWKVFRYLSKQPLLFKSVVVRRTGQHALSIVAYKWDYFYMLLTKIASVSLKIICSAFSDDEPFAS